MNETFLSLQPRTSSVKSTFCRFCKAYWSDPSTMQQLPSELMQLREAVAEERRVGLQMIETQWNQCAKRTPGKAAFRTGEG